MNKKLVAYFSASGVTAQVAKTLAEAVQADLYEIKPQIAYTRQDLDWTDKTSRSTLEMNDPTCRPAMAGTCGDLDQYDTVFVGFPIWWYTAPSIIHTFLESCDLTGKTVIPFATSGGSGMGQTSEQLRPSCPGAQVLEGRVFRRSANKAELKSWADSL